MELNEIGYSSIYEFMMQMRLVPKGMQGKRREKQNVIISKIEIGICLQFEIYFINSINMVIKLFKSEEICGIKLQEMII